MSQEFPSWVSDNYLDAQSWNQVALGDVYLPGLCSIEGLDVGIDVDHKKKKGSDQPKSDDQGIRPSRFAIKVWLTAKDWPLWLDVLPTFHPRRPGRARQPVEIVHPDPNSLGIKFVRVVSIKPGQSTAKGGKVIQIECIEWFDTPADTKKNNKAKVADLRNGARFLGAALGSAIPVLGQEVSRRALTATDEQVDSVGNVLRNLFGGGGK
jgi:hypothetical protein